MTTLRVINDPAASGVWNMAVDEMMLETVAASGEPIVRFYQWEEPTLSLGYFQSLADRQSHPASLNCPVVRRSTGGGAILHDRELTYSVAVPLADRWSQTATLLYDTFHAGLIAALAKLGLVAVQCPATVHPLQPEFLCFQRRAKGDVLVGGHKVAGSAQRRRQGALLQHGSVILEQSEFAPEIPGLKELGLSTSALALASLWSAEIQRAWPTLVQQPGHWSAEEAARAGAIGTTRFSSPEWLARRTYG